MFSVQKKKQVCSLSDTILEITGNKLTATDKSYLDYVLSILEEYNNITFRPMMGEYLLYTNGILFGGVYDNRFLIKETTANREFNLQEEIPYNGGRKMYLVDIEDPKKIKNLIEKTVKGLK